MHIDHVEIFVPDRRQAAEWYRRALGFEVRQEHLDWAEGEGPLMIGRPGAGFMLALFTGPPQGTGEVRGLRRVAFRASAEGFARFIASSGGWRDPPLDPAAVQDHDKALSIYFTDPWGTRLEVTTYEPDAARELLAGGA